MRGPAERGHEVQGRPSRWRLGLLVASLAVLAVALMPASASAQGATCTAEVFATQGQATAGFNLECDEGIVSFRVSSALPPPPQPGTVDGNTGVNCDPVPADPTILFNCNVDQPNNGIASGRFIADDGDVCDDPPLALQFLLIQTDESGGSLNVGPIEITGCPTDGGPGNGDGDPDDDSGTTPSGGVQSGAGGTADDGGSALMPVGLGLILAGTLGLGAVGLVRRRA